MDSLYLLIGLSLGLNLWLLGRHVMFKRQLFKALKSAREMRNRLGYSEEVWHHLNHEISHLLRFKS